MMIQTDRLTDYAYRPTDRCYFRENPRWWTTFIL